MFNTNNQPTYFTKTAGKNTDRRIKAKALVPEATGTDEALALVSLGTGLWVGHLAGVLTEPSLRYCQRYCDRPVIEDGELNLERPITVEKYCIHEKQTDNMTDWRRTIWGYNCMIIFRKTKKLQEANVKNGRTETRGAVILLV